MSSWTMPAELTAKKDHQCSWCGEAILEKERYWRWRWFAYNEASTCKSHPECYAAMTSAAVANEGIIEFTHGEYKRGTTEENC